MRFVIAGSVSRGLHARPVPVWCEPAWVGVRDDRGLRVRAMPASGVVADYRRSLALVAVGFRALRWRAP